MSIQAVAWVLDHSRSRGITRLVLISLANHHNRGTGQCNPGQRCVAREAGVAVGTVPAAIARLVVLGELEIEELGGSHRSTRYRLPFAQEPSVEVDELRSRRERSARPKAERSARPRAEQNRKNRNEPNDAFSEMQEAAEVIYAENAERAAALRDEPRERLSPDELARLLADARGEQTGS